MSSLPTTCNFSMKNESGSSGGGGCVGVLREKEMIWQSHLLEMKKISRFPKNPSVPA